MYIRLYTVMCIQIYCIIIYIYVCIYAHLCVRKLDFALGLLHHVNATPMISTAALGPKLYNPQALG